MGINFKELKKRTKDKDDEIEPLPDGRYNFKIESGEEGVSKNDNPKIEFTLSVIEDDEYANRKVWHTFSLLPQAQIYLFKFLEAAGSDVIDSDEEISNQEMISSVVGNYINGYVEKYSPPQSDKIRNRIGGAFKPYESNETSPAQSSSSSSSSSSKQKSNKKKKKLFS